MSDISQLIPDFVVTKTLRDDYTEIRLKFDKQPGAIVARIETIGPGREYLNSEESGNVYFAFEASEQSRLVADITGFDETFKRPFLEFINQVCETMMAGG